MDLLILVGGYIGCLFISFLCMWMSAKTRSTVMAVTISLTMYAVLAALLVSGMYR